MICAATDKLFQTACDVLNLPELKNNPLCSNNMGRLEHNDLIKDRFEKALAAKTVGEWYPLFVQRGVPAGPINTVNQALDLPTVEERDMIVSAGEYNLPGCPIKLSSYQETKTRNPAPSLNQDEAAIRKEFQTS